MSIDALECAHVPETTVQCFDKACLEVEAVIVIASIALL
jgi:hypothetical protein